MTTTVSSYHIHLTYQYQSLSLDNVGLIIFHCLSIFNASDLHKSAVYEIYNFCLN